MSAKGPCYQFKWPVNGRCADLVYCSSVYKPIFVLDCLTFVTVVVRYVVVGFVCCKVTGKVELFQLRYGN